MQPINGTLWTDPSPSSPAFDPIMVKSINGDAYHAVNQVGSMVWGQCAAAVGHLVARDAGVQS